MQIARNKTMATTIALVLMLTMAIPLVALPTASAANNAPAGMKWDFPGAENVNASDNRLLLWNRWRDQILTYVYIVPTPNPVGVGQQVTFILFNPQVPQPSTARYLFTITITKPDQTSETLPPAGAQGIYAQAIQDGKFVSDSTGSAWTTWTPTQIGNHTVTVKFHGLAVPNVAYATSTDRDWYGVTLKESTYTTTLVVQQEPVIPTSWSTVPLPTEYWTRPIEGQNNEWYRVASNWLNNAHDRTNGGADNKYQQDGISPNSGHILWTKPTEDGGVVGGGNFSVPGEVFNAGHQYQTRFESNQIIMHGRLYYREPQWYSATPGDYVCVDLRTGEEIWRNTTMSAIPAFGYYYDWDDMNQHGVVPPSWLFSSNYGTAIHPRFGITATLNITSVPSGTSVYGPKGEELRYVVTNVGNSSNPNYYVAQWNSSKVFISAISGNIAANVPFNTTSLGTNTYWNGSMWVSNAVRTAQGYTATQWTTPSYDWNVSIPIQFTSTSGTPTIRGAILNDVLLLSNGSLPSAPSYTYTESVTFFAVSLKPANRGTLLWGPTAIKIVDDKNHNYDFQRAAEGVFVFQRTPDMGWMAYDMYTGKKLWETDFGEGDYNPYAYYISSTGYNPTGNAIAYGKLFSTGYVGIVFCYDLQNGTLLWRYEAPTNMEKFEYYTLLIGVINDGKIYIGTHEHSADTPLFKGARVRCLNVTTGEEVWSMLGWANPRAVQVADGILTYWNNYDHQVYAVGKGPSATTVEAPLAAITQGSSLVIRGTVTDISAGTKQNEQAARFPNGVPAVSDASQSAWMEYVYMQKPRPSNATGVEVTLDTIDPNGNWIHIGTATSDSSGTFSYQWTPDVPGKYTVIATFAGTNSYWPSYAETAVGVDEAPPAPPAPEPAAPLPPYETYTIGTGIAIIAAVAIVGLMLLRKKP